MLASNEAPHEDTIFNPEHAYQIFAGNPDAVTYAGRIMLGEA